MTDPKSGTDETTTAGRHSGTEAPGVSVPTDPPVAAVASARAHEHGTVGRLLRRIVDWEPIGVVIATVAVLVVTTIFHPEFFTYDQLVDVLRQSVFIAIIATGMAFLIAMRELDLSVGSIYGLTAMAGGLLMQDHGLNPWLAALACVGIGAVCGLVNSLIVQVIGITSIIATLATLLIFRGLDYGLAKGTQVANLPIDHAFFRIVGGDVRGFPVSVIILGVVTALLTVVLRFTPFGYRVRAIGSNPEAATFSGISIPRVRMLAMMLIGALAGLAGALSLAYFVTADPNQGIGFELSAIAAAVIGGNALRGGICTPFGAVLGAVLLGLVGTSLIYFGIPIDWSAFATGVTILAAVSVDAIVRRIRDRVRQQ